ncbi:TetR/AcrR family transcriptional regulator [Amycolatopsis sp.]|uniref:TetR/AcrR family transcriptional regulator n=1 Tax=Amycolatopsis sp. TaxID=37632 RepID=UPI002CA0EBA5|nr:TetR/AcrR family transcriptional regulator [Amycolatopsis sp.]HVV07880.1 TetR/AcrR family transcriptional regulator [Amycolatopsis sp.]
MPKPPRERIVFSAAQLIRTQGVSGTGMRDVVSHAGAPRGSLQHYFPGGKEQLVNEAVAWAGGYAARRIRRAVDAMDEPTPGGLFAAMIAQWRDELTAEQFTKGCPLVAAAVDTAAVSEGVRDAVSEAFTGWRRPAVAALREMGVPPARSESLALLMISALEGAIVLARAHRDTAPLDAVLAELRPLLDAAVER